ncbi:MAG: GGDEF domain-containing protein, partial [Calditrichaeota bacterium]
MPRKHESLEQELRALQHKFAEIETAYSKLQRDFQQVDTLYTVVSELSAVLDLEQLTVRTKRLFKKVIPADLFALCLVDTHNAEVQFLGHFGTPRAWTKLTRRLQKGTAFYDATKKRKPVLVKADLNGAVDFAEYTRLDRLRGDFLVLPLLAPDGRDVVGLLTLLRSSQNGFDASDVGLIKTVAAQIGQILHKVLLFEKTRALSITDELTGVFNRRYFKQRFEQENLRAKRYGHHLSILMLDIDNFKIYNDRNGHLMGDEVLVKVARL